MVRPAPEHIVPWNQHNRHGKPGTVCAWCLDRLPADCTGWFTQMVPWRDWRPIRYVCQSCIDDKPTWDHLCTIDAVYLGVMEVEVVSPLWYNTTSLKFKPLDKLNDPFIESCRLYRPRTTVPLPKRSTWIRFLNYAEQNMICLHVQSHLDSQRMDIVPIQKLEEWNPELGAFQFRFVNDTVLNLDLLHRLTDNDNKCWWDLLKERLSSDVVVLSDSERIKPVE